MYDYPPVYDYHGSGAEAAPGRPVYYRIYLNRDGLICVVEMQDFDELDYTESKFFRGPDGERLKFDDEDQARALVNQTFKRSVIHPDDLTPNHAAFMIGGDDAALRDAPDD